MDKETDLNDSLQGFLVIGVIIAIATYRYLPQIKSYFSNGSFWLIIFLIVACIYLVLFGLTHISIKSVKFFINKIIEKIEKRQERTNRIQIETREIEDLMLKDFTIEEQSLTKDVESLRNKMSFCKRYEELSHFIPQVKERLAQAIKLLEQARKENYSKKLKEKIEMQKWEREVLDREIDEKRRKNISYEYNTRIGKLHLLNTLENYVFEKNKLDKEELASLLGEGYLIYSEYCMVKKKLINVLIRKQLNHSATHTFLVWNAIKLLRKIKGARNIREHLSVDADITFDFNGKKYALEIETGTLLKKRKQLQEKVEYNNKKYKNRWMFIVSNRNFLGKFNKWAFTSPRNRMLENLSKMLEISHPL